jgi:hypothetical protein
VEIFDVRGRRVANRDLGAHGPGSHRVSLGSGDRLPAGVYTIRLTQDDQHAIARAVILK